MCHLILLMPVLALPVFWLMPLSLAIPVYVIIVSLSALFYWLIAKSMGKRPVTGCESLIGAMAEVVSKLGPKDRAQYLVRTQGELWSADSTDALEAGEMVSIAAVEGMRLIVQRNGSSIASIEDGVRKISERHCH